MEQVAVTLEAKRETIIELMLATTNGPTPPNEQRQFISGFIDLVIAAARGDTTPRDEYLDAVIPGCKGAGMAQSMVVSAMVPVSMALALHLPSDAFAWTSAFCMDYTARIMSIWERS